MGDTKAWQDSLPPIVRERLVKIGTMTPEEKERAKDHETLNSILAPFYKGKLKPEELWQRLKEQGKPDLLVEAQLNLVNSLSLGDSPEELNRRKDVILGIETLKKEPRTPIIEPELNSIVVLVKRYKDELQRVYNDFKSQVENNPQLRVKQIRQGQATMVVELTVDEAINQLPQWKDFLSKHETRYSQEFQKLVERLKAQVQTVGAGKKKESSHPRGR